MALTQDDLVGAVAKLNELTRQQVIRWHACNPGRTSLGDSLFSAPYEAKGSFEANHDGRLLRITQYAGSGGLLSMGETFYRYVLDVRDSDGNAIFEFPEVAGISDLFRSIQTQALDIEGFIRKLVNS
jgi:hypothetical protein